MHTNAKYIPLLLVILALAFCSSHGQSTRHWTAVGDDNQSGGPAVGHMCAFSLDSAALVQADAGTAGWDTTIAGVWFIKPADLPQYQTPGTTVTVSLPWDWFPTDTIVFMSMKAYDDAVDPETGAAAPNWSPLGNILRVRTPDRIAPAAIVDFR